MCENFTETTRNSSVQCLLVLLYVSYFFLFYLPIFKYTCALLHFCPNTSWLCSVSFNLSRHFAFNMLKAVELCSWFSTFLIFYKLSNLLGGCLIYSFAFSFDREKWRYLYFILFLSFLGFFIYFIITLYLDSKYYAKHELLFKFG